MNGIVYKQSFKSRNLKKTPMLNCKHLNYIATRPGAIHNPGCGFGLFGKLDNFTQPGNLNSLTGAKKIISDVSRRNTIYRAIFSLDHEAALRYGYYDRAKWEELIYENIQALAKEMHIPPHDLRYAASFHCEKGHPHVHVMYWNNSRRIQNECIPKEQFECIAQNVRTAFSRAVFHDELTQLRNERRTDMDSIQSELRALFHECNPYDVLNLRQVQPAQLQEISIHLLGLAENLPETGRLAYGFMPSAYKQQLNACIDAVFAIPQLHKLQNKLQELSAQIYKLSGYGPKSEQWHTEKDQQAFYKTMGNEILRYIKEHQAAWKHMISADTPASETDDTGASATSTSAEGASIPGGLVATLRDVLAADATLRTAYQSVRRAMPLLRTPFQNMPEEFSQHFHDLMCQLLENSDITACVNALARSQIGEESPKKLSRLCWKLLAQTLQQTLYIDAGYAKQEQADMSIDFLANFFRFVSQEQHYQQAALQQRTAFHDLSQTAKKDLLQRLSQQGDWDLE